MPTTVGTGRRGAGPAVRFSSCRRTRQPAGVAAASSGNASEGASAWRMMLEQGLRR
ncbi:MAG TPA: hypothetical protein VGQ83_23840 [Polyangia bacterium]